MITIPVPPSCLLWPPPLHGRSPGLSPLRWPGGSSPLTGHGGRCFAFLSFLSFLSLSAAGSGVAVGCGVGAAVGAAGGLGVGSGSASGWASGWASGNRPAPSASGGPRRSAPASGSDSSSTGRSDGSLEGTGSDGAGVGSELAPGALGATEAGGPDESGGDESGGVDRRRGRRRRRRGRAGGGRGDRGTGAADGDVAVRTRWRDDSGGQRDGRENEVQEPHGDDQAGALSSCHVVGWAPWRPKRSPPSGPPDGSTEGPRPAPTSPAEPPGGSARQPVTIVGPCPSRGPRQRARRSAPGPSR